MNIIGISAVRNEQDVIEAFVRHTLTFCDRLLITDHGSTDATPTILKALQDEGLALEVTRNETVGIIQTALMNRLSERAAHVLQADWIFCLDADEFVQGDVRTVLARHEASGGPGYLQYWLVNYVVRPEDDPGELNPAKRINHRTIDHVASGTDRRTCKSIVSGDLARQEGFFVGAGNHRVSVRGEEPPFKIVNGLWLGHFSLRSPCQYGGKVVSAMFQRYGERSRLMGNLDFYEADYRRLRESYTGFARDFVNVPLPWWSKTITGIESCPIDYRGGELRYTPAVSDVDQFIRNTLDWGLRMAQTAAATQTEAGEETKAPERVFIALRDGEEAVRKQAFEANTSSFLEVRFSLTDRGKGHRLILELACGPGVVEIERVQLRFANGSHREFREGALADLLTVVRDGVAARAGAVQRFFSSIPPVILNVWGDANQATELVLHIRFLNEHRMVSALVGDFAGVPWIDKQLRKGERGSAPVNTPLNAAFTLSPLEPGQLVIGEGWGPLRFSGLKLSKNRGRLGLRFAERLKGRLRLKFDAIVKFDKHPQTAANGGIVRVVAEGVPVVVWQLRETRQWIEIDLAAAPTGRRGIDLVFEVEDACAGFRIKRAKVEALHEGGWMARALKRALDFLERRRLPQQTPKSLASGETVRFGTGGKGLELATTGWAPPGEGGCRAEATLAILRFSVAAPSPKGLKVRLLLAGGGGSGVVRLAWENKDLISWWVEAQTPQWMEVRLPSEAAGREEILLLFRSSGMSIGFELREMVLQVDQGVAHGPLQTQK